MRPAGDVNGDGYNDMRVGGYNAGSGSDRRAGETYVVFGSGGGFAASLDLATLDGNNGFRLDGIDAGTAVVPDELLSRRTSSVTPLALARVANRPFGQLFEAKDFDDLELLESDPSSVRGTAYDLVYNGNELGSGSIRVHQSELQRRILRALGLGDDEIEQKFGFLLRALSAGAPPHGGIALGMDRIVQRFSGSESLRDVIALPKTTAARALYEEAPASVGNEELSELGLTTLKSSEG